MASECANCGGSVVYCWWCSPKITSNITVIVAVYRLAGRIFSRKIMWCVIIYYFLLLFFVLMWTTRPRFVVLRGKSRPVIRMCPVFILYLSSNETWFC